MGQRKGNEGGTLLNFCCVICVQMSMVSLVRCMTGSLHEAVELAEECIVVILTSRLITLPTPTTLVILT